jgi:hypothetical protein
MPQPKAKGSDRFSRPAVDEGEGLPADPGVNGKRGPGRPPIHAEEWTKATVVLFNRQIEFLDELAASIRAHNGTPVSRAQLIRAVVDAVAASGVDLTPAGSEAEMKAILLERLHAAPADKERAD